jgi:hypothetical protein
MNALAALPECVLAQPLSTCIALAALFLSILSLWRTARVQDTSARQIEAEKKSQVFYQLTQTRLVLDALETRIQNTLAAVMQYAPEQCDILNQRPDHDDYFKELTRFGTRVSEEQESSLSMYERVLIGPRKLSAAELETNLGFAKEAHLKIQDFRKQAEPRCHEIMNDLKSRDFGDGGPDLKGGRES